MDFNLEMTNTQFFLLDRRTFRYQMKLKFLGNPSNIYEAIRPIFCYYKFFGLIPFSFDGAIKNGKFKFAEFNKVWIFLVLCFHFYSSWSLVESSGDFKNPDASVLIAIGWMICMLFQIGIVVFSTFNLIFKIRKFERFLDVLHEFDQKVRD
jgi:hypothetical protein